MTMLSAPQELHLGCHNASKLEQDGKAPKSTKEMRAMLDGVFPMGKAVIDGEDSSSTTNSTGTSTHQAAAQWHYHQEAPLSQWRTLGQVLRRSLGGMLLSMPEVPRRCYFVKVAYGEGGQVMLHGEYESSKVVYRTMSDFILNHSALESMRHRTHQHTSPCPSSSTWT